MSINQQRSSVFTIIKDVITCGCCSNHNEQIAATKEDSPTPRPKSMKAARVVPDLESMDDDTTSRSASVVSHTMEVSPIWPACLFGPLLGSGRVRPPAQGPLLADPSHHELKLGDDVGKCLGEGDADAFFERESAIQVRREGAHASLPTFNPLPPLFSTRV